MRLFYVSLSLQSSADGNRKMYFADRAKENQCFFLKEWEGSLLLKRGFQVVWTEFRSKQRQCTLSMWPIEGNQGFDMTCYHSKDSKENAF